MKEDEINNIRKIKSDLENTNSSKKNNILNKSSNLFELLRAKKGQNINIDLSMLSNKGTLTNLIEKAKKYQISPNKKKIDKQSKNSPKRDIDHLEIQNNIKFNKKLSNQIEILEKFSKKMNKYEKNIEKDIENNNINENKESEKDIFNIKTHQKKQSQSSYKTASDGTRTKTDQISNKEKSENLSQQEQEEYIYEEVDSYSSSQVQSKKHSKQSSNISDNNNINNNYNNIKTNKNKINLIPEKNIYNDNFAIEYETVKENYSIKSCNTVLEYSFRESQNIESQANMEDKSKSVENFNNNKNQMLFELFDGHGGEDISNFLQQNFVHIYKQYLKLNNYDIPKSLSNSFQDIDDIIKDNLSNLNGMGSTGTIIHLFWETKSKLMVYTANIGDSRASLISPNHIIKLSYDHRMSDEKEKERILENGIEVIENRIGGELMLTRSFGDYEFKESNKNGVICEPFLSKIKIDLNIRDQFLILASDGIWDLVSEKEIQQMIKKNNNSEKLCALIIKKALDKEAWDNMSVFAIRLT